MFICFFWYLVRPFLHFNDPGAAEEATAVFGEAAALCIQKQHLHHGLASQNLQTSIEDRNLVSGRNLSSEDVSPRQLKHIHANNLREIPGNYHGAAMSGATASQSLNSGPSSTAFYNTPSPMVAQVRSWKHSASSYILLLSQASDFYIFQVFVFIILFLSF